MFILRFKATRDCHEEKNKIIPLYLCLYLLQMANRLETRTYSGGDCGLDDISVALDAIKIIL